MKKVTHIPLVVLSLLITVSGCSEPRSAPFIQKAWLQEAMASPQTGPALRQIFETCFAQQGLGFDSEPDKSQKSAVAECITQQARELAKQEDVDLSADVVESALF